MSAVIRSLPGSVFQLKRELDRLPPDLRLRHIEWGVLLAVDGQRTATEIGCHFQLSREAQEPIFERLLDLRLIEERPVTFSQYLRARSTTGDEEPLTLGQFLSPGVSMAPAFDAPETQETSVPVNADLATQNHRNGLENPAIPPDLQREAPPVTRVIPTIQAPSATPAFEPLAPPPKQRADTFDPNRHETMPTPTLRALNRESDTLQLSLKTLMKCIIDRAADVNAGQLDVYRVFIRIDSQLLKRNGITTLRFEDDRLIDDPTLKEAIAASLEHTLGLSCPPEAFVAASEHH